MTKFSGISASPVSIIVVSAKEDHSETVNTALRECGHAARCLWVNHSSKLSDGIAEHARDLVVLASDGDSPVIEQCVQLCAGDGVQVPLLVLGSDTSEDAIARVMQSGARDLVSLDNIARLRSVASRELRTCRLEKTLQQVMNSARQFKHELNSLKNVSVEAIADVQEGIIVHTNPAWLELFGHPEGTDLMGLPVMDICTKPDHSALKGGIVACQRGKWQDDVLEVRAVNSEGQEFRVEFCLENVAHDGEPAVRMLVKPDNNDAMAANRVLEKTLQQDQVTGFYHRQHFAEMANDRLNQPPSGGVRAIAFVRIDRFGRATNDIGIIGTDTVIAQFAQLLRDYTQTTDIYGRFGGTMFAIMLERGTMDDAEAWAASLLNAVGEAVFEVDQRSTVLTCSIGLCELDTDETGFQSAVAEAERACRAARQKGGNTVEFSEASGMAKQIRQTDNLWVPRIRGALMDNRFRLEHQPIAGLNSEISNAYDVLVRMLDEDGNTVLASEFMPVAERTGMSKNIDRWVIGAALSFCLTNSAELLFVRLSRDSVLDETLIEWLDSQLERTHVTAQRICFEVDEQIALEHLSSTQKIADQLHQRGFKFAIEHFGKNDQCSQLLARVNMDIAKLDGSLMQGLHKNAATQDVVKSLAAAANNAGIKTVAERVQDANTMAVLWQLGVSYIQGNYVQKHDIVIEDTSQSTVTTRALQLQT